MKFNHLLNISLIGLMISLFSACSPTKEDTGSEPLSDNSKQWIPFTGTESLTFFSDTIEMVFIGQEKESIFENIRYSSDQSGFFSIQKDYYADLEKQTLKFKSSGTPYFFKYHLQKYMGESGSWDILRVSLADGEYYKNEIKIVVFETDKFDKGEIFKYVSSINLNGQVFNEVYFWKQENRPFELYYTKEQGIVGFKLSSNELWTLKQSE